MRVTAADAGGVERNGAPWPRVAERAGATRRLSGAGGADWEYGYAASAGARLLHDGDRFTVGNGHGACSACGKALGAVPGSAVGYEELANWGTARARHGGAVVGA